MSASFAGRGMFKNKTKVDLELQALLDREPERPHRSLLDLMVAWSIIGMFVIAMSVVIYLLEPILMPVTLAIVVGMVLGRAADQLSRFGLPPGAGGLLLGLIFAVGLFLLFNALVEPIGNLVSAAPAMIERSVERMLPFLNRFEWARHIIDGANEKTISDMAMANAGAVLGALAAGLTPAFVQAAIFLAALGLFLLGRAHLRKTIIMALITRERRLTAIRIMNATENAVGFYFSTASLIYLALGTITGLIAFIGGLSMAPLWGVFAFISSFIPYLGVTAMTAALLCAGLMTHDALLLAVAPAAGFFLLHLVMENLVTPAILGSRLEINPFLIFIAIIFWTWMWGAVGAMLAMPLSLIAMTIFNEVRSQPPERQIPG